ncbi:cell wall protein DAN4-like [Spodoptera litura]|uniref:Cell wall protein DAN4-like n=1 Tax=Spodoptera litura TaxID=69820 RepID=A0A9J7EBP6_SPOLT|nr:cell wall protein DAN4-like [Spodoptera litura]
MFIKTLIITSFLTTYVVSDSCVTYNFEENFDDTAGSYGICSSGWSAWILDEYSNLNLDGPDERSTKFITPRRDASTSCWSSSVFTISPGGTLDVKIYMDSEDSGGSIDLFVFYDGTNTIAGIGFVNSQTIKGWYTMNVPLSTSSTIKAYISILGVASTSSTVLVDSFRYKPPGMNESLCQTYEDPPTTPVPTTTPQPTTTTVPTTIPEPTTNEPTTTSESTTTPRPTTTIAPTVTSPVSTTASPCVSPPTDAEDTTWFWTKIIIGLIIILNLIVLVLTCIIFYELGRRKAVVPSLRREVSTPQ